MHAHMKLGKLPARYDKRTLMLASYVDARLPPPPAVVNWASPGKITVWPMYQNDKIGDCTCAGVAHMVETWTGNAGKLIVPTDDAVIKLYEQIGGYKPGDESTDNGAYCLDVLKFWRQQGIALPDGTPDKVGAFAAVGPRNTVLVKDAIYLMGGLYCGVQLPLSAQDQDVWDVSPGWWMHQDCVPGSWGGHCINVVGYDPRGLTCVTWGALKRMTWAFWKAYCDESYALFANDWIKPGSGTAPNGLDVKTLMADLAKL